MGNGHDQRHDDDDKSERRQLVELRTIVRELVSLHSDFNDFRDLLCRKLECKEKQKTRLVVMVIGPDEPIEGKSMLVKLAKPIKPGFRRPVSFKYDEPVDIRPDGSYLGTEIVEGDSSVTVKESTANGATVYINGDGAIGTKLARFIADGAVGEREVSITLDIAFEVATPDATEFKEVTEGADEPIPGVGGEA